MNRDSVHSAGINFQRVYVYIMRMYAHYAELIGQVAPSGLFLIVCKPYYVYVLMSVLEGKTSLRKIAGLINTTWIINPVSGIASAEF